jgi:hypothetical protein
LSINPDGWWDEQPKPKPHGGRVVKHLHDDEEEATDPTKPQVIPFVAGDAKGNLITAKGEAMPKGQYVRKPKAAANDAETPAAPKRKGGRPKGSQKANGAAVARPGAIRILMNADSIAFEGITEKQRSALLHALEATF